MARPKRRTIGSSIPKPTKKQRLKVVNELCHSFYPSFTSEESNYGKVKEFVINNKSLYPWLNTTTLHNGLRRMKKQIAQSSVSTNISIPDDSSVNSNETPITIDTTFDMKLSIP